MKESDNSKLISLATRFELYNYFPFRREQLNLLNGLDKDSINTKEYLRIHGELDKESFSVPGHTYEQQIMFLS